MLQPLPHPFIGYEGAPALNLRSKSPNILTPLTVPRVRTGTICSPALRPPQHGRKHLVAYESRELIYGHLKPEEATHARRVGEAPGPPPH